MRGQVIGFFCNDRLWLTRMNDQWAVVVAVDERHVTIRVEESGCGRCHQAGGCGSNSLGKLFCQTPRVFRIVNNGDYAVGARVRVGIADGAIGKSVWLSYVVPLLAVLVGAVAGSLVNGEIGAIAGAVGGLFCGWLSLRHAHRRHGADPRFQPTIRG